MPEYVVHGRLFLPTGKHMHEKGILPSSPLDEEWARLIRRVVFSCRQIHRVPRIHGEIVRHGMLIPIRKAMGSRRTETGIFQEREWLLFRETSNWIRIPLPFYLLSVEMHDEIDTGGMPEAVQAYVDNRLPSDTRAIQKTIIADYALDISKHAPKEILGRIHQVWNSIPQQLVKQNRKFLYGDIQKGARAKDFELAIQWLIDAGMIAKIPRVRKAGIPLKYYEDFSAFKLFLSDLGLMGAMVDAPISQLVSPRNMFSEFKGSFSEQYVFQQLQKYISNGIFYYSAENSQAEIDFLLQTEEHLVPVEVKAEENLQAKSLRQFAGQYPDSRPVRVSMSSFRKETWMVNLPLYAVSRIMDAVSR